MWVQDWLNIPYSALTLVSFHSIRIHELLGVSQYGIDFAAPGPPDAAKRVNKSSWDSNPRFDT